MLILITTRKSLPLVPDKIRPYFRQVLINIRQVLNISQVPNIIPIQQLVVDFHRYIQRVRDVPHQHPTQASRNPRSNPELTREEAPPTYDAPWWRYYEQTLDPDGVLINARCKVSNYKTSYNYVIKNSLSQFKKYAYKHIGKNEEPQERPDTRMVQSCLNSDGTRTLVKYDEKIMLNEFARYITKKEQPISMSYCTNFARLLIRGCGQQLYKRFHHNKMVSELKKIC
jgi:hypothetical protein